VTVAGDAMHVMGPYIGQGGSAALEDAVVLARTLSRSVLEGVIAVVHGNGSTRSRELQEKKISAALGEYVRERRARLFMLSLESYVIGTLRMAKSLLKKIACVAMLTLLGSESRRHANYDCGPL
jgi:2-polyprenyl-6-methoxyphenol hydroxylase-like FAD-dependent oxidoreductase